MAVKNYIYFKSGHKDSIKSFIHFQIKKTKTRQTIPIPIPIPILIPIPIPISCGVFRNSLKRSPTHQTSFTFKNKLSSIVDAINNLDANLGDKLCKLADDANLCIMMRFNRRKKRFRCCGFLGDSLVNGFQRWKVQSYANEIVFKKLLQMVYNALNSEKEFFTSKLKFSKQCFTTYSKTNKIWEMFHVILNIKLKMLHILLLQYINPSYLLISNISFNFGSRISESISTKLKKLQWKVTK